MDGWSIGYEDTIASFYKCIKRTSDKIAKVVGYQGKFTFDKSYEDGTPKKLLDVSLINSLGWYSKISLEDGLTKTYKWFKENINSLKK